MKIFYWSPFLSNIATIDAVVNSIKSIKKFDKKKKIQPYIIDATGEWIEKSDKTQNLNVISLDKKKYYNSLPKGGYVKSRLSQILIFLLSFNKLRKLLKHEKPEYLIAHLIISLPLLLFNIFDFKTKLIIRISGTPKMNFLRKFFWSKFSKKVKIVTCPTKTTYDNLKRLKIFPEEKLKILYDPVISIKHILINKNETIEKSLSKDTYILSIGRLTRQKNFSLLIKFYNEINKKYPDIKLVILGEGEERTNLEAQIKKYQLEEKIFLLGFKKNVFSYINQCQCFVSSSLYEDPGFAIVEAGCLNKIIFAADSKTGPSEILNESKRGYLFENDNYKSLVNNFYDYKNSSKEIVYKKKIEIKKYCKNFTFFSHYTKLIKIIS